MTTMTRDRADRAGARPPPTPPAATDNAARDPVAVAPRRHSLRRRWDDLPLRTKGMYVVAIPVVPLILSAIFFLAGGRTARSAQEWVSHTLEVKTEIATVLSLMVDAESGVRGFLLTHDVDALAPFTNATAALPGDVAHLRSLTADNPAQVEHLRTLADLMAARSLTLTRVLDYTRRNPDGPLPLALLVESRTRMGAIRTELAQMQQIEDALLARRVADVRLANRRLVFVSLIAVLLGLAGGLIATRSFTAGVSRRVERLGDSAGRLAAGEALPPLVEAADEVGLLDRRMHDAARLLRRRDEQLKQQALEQAVVNDELEAFSYSVSHDLRAPLRHITGFASLLKRSVADRLTETEARHLQTIVDAASRMGRLIDDLLAFSRMGRTAITSHRVSLDDTVRDALQEVQAAAADREIRWTLHPLPVVDGDPAMLRLVFVNLLSNAVKYSAGRAVADIEVGVGNGAANETAVYVRDNGAGFDMQYAHKLFGVFQRLHSADEFDGTGIGLANVQRIVHRHGGRVWANGIVDGGATFFFSLPTTGEVAP